MVPNVSCRLSKRANPWISIKSSLLLGSHKGHCAVQTSVSFWDFWRETWATWLMSCSTHSVPQLAICQNMILQIWMPWKKVEKIQLHTTSTQKMAGYRFNQPFEPPRSCRRSCWRPQHLAPRRRPKERSLCQRWHSTPRWQVVNPKGQHIQLRRNKKNMLMLMSCHQPLL